MSNKPKGYWTSVFLQATLLMKQRRSINGDTAFWLARDIVDKNLGGEREEMSLSLPFRQSFAAQETLVLAP